jgi:hypothetical protein
MIFNSYFHENTKILCFNVDLQKEMNVNISSLKEGDLVKTLYDGYKPITRILKQVNHSVPTFIYYKNQFPELFQDLIITGSHSILVDEITDNQREEIEKMLGQIFVTDKKYRLPVCLDSRALKIQNHDEINLYHIVLENDNEQNNYGIYANGLLVESISLYDAMH